MAPGRASPAESPLRARALRLLARREHSREELRRKLRAHAGEGDDIEALLEDFTARGWLSEERFVEQAVRARARRFGPLKIASHLRERGVDEAGISKGLALARAEESEALAAAWRSRFGRAPVDAAGKAKQVRFLEQRGFALEAILRFLREAGTPR